MSSISPKPATDAKNTTMNLIAAASAVLDTYIALTPGVNIKDKSKLGGAAIIENIFPKLPTSVRTDLAKTYPDLAPFLKS